MSFSTKDLNPHNYPMDPPIEDNLKVLAYKLDRLAAAYGQPLVITSGLRDAAQQKQLIAEGKSNAPKSHHLVGEAADIYDPDSALHDWVKANDATIIDIGLWMEERQGPWQHFQIVPPKSKKRWFNP